MHVRFSDTKRSGEAGVARRLPINPDLQLSHMMRNPYQAAQPARRDPSASALDGLPPAWTDCSPSRSLAPYLSEALGHKPGFRARHPKDLERFRIAATLIGDIQGFQRSVLVDKVRDIVDLISRPNRALVLSVDEKTAYSADAPDPLSDRTASVE